MKYIFAIVGVLCIVGSVGCQERSGTTTSERDQKSSAPGKVTLSIASTRRYPFELGKEIEVILYYFEEGRQGATIDLPSNTKLMVTDIQGRSISRKGSAPAITRLIACKEIGLFSASINLAECFQIDRPGQYTVAWKIGDIGSNAVVLTVK